MLSRFHLILECHGRTDGRTDRQTDRIAISILRISVLTCDKNCNESQSVKSMVWAVFQYAMEWWTLKKSDRNRIEAFEMWCWRKMLNISWQEHRTNDSINRMGLGKRGNGKSGKAETTIFWPHYSWHLTLRRTFGTYSPRRNHVRVMASRETEKTVDTRRWRVDWLQIHSAKRDVTRSSTVEKKDIGVVICCANPHRGRSTSEWVSDHAELNPEQNASKIVIIS